MGTISFTSAGLRLGFINFIANKNGHTQVTNGKQKNTKAIFSLLPKLSARVWRDKYVLLAVYTQFKKIMRKKLM